MADGDRTLHLVGAALVVAVVAGLVVVGLNFAGSSGAPAPDADWTVERVNASHVRVTHAGGEAVPADELRVTVDSLRRATDWPDPVTESDSVAVPAAEGTLVRVVYLGGRGDRVVLASERT